MVVDIERFESFTSELNKLNPKFNIKFKNESLLMKTIGILLFFNKDFMRTYTTTIGNTVYFPSKQFIEDSPESALIIAAHEYRHAYDANRINSLLFSIIYLMPQLLVLLIVPALYLFGYWGLLCLIFLFPLPAYGRMRLELNGYVTSLFVLHALLVEAKTSEEYRALRLQQSAIVKNKQFTGSAYYFMWPFGVKTQLFKALDEVIDGTMVKEKDALNQIYEAFVKSKK